MPKPQFCCASQTQFTETQTILSSAAPSVCRVPDGIVLPAAPQNNVSFARSIVSSKNRDFVAATVSNYEILEAGVPKKVGAVFIYSKETNRDTYKLQQVLLPPPNTDNQNIFAIIISMSADGRCLLVNSKEDKGAVYVYQRKVCEFCFTETQRIVSPSLDVESFGLSVSLSPDGKVAMILESNTSVRVFTRNSKKINFTAADFLKPTDAEAFSVSGKKFILDFLDRISISQDGKFAAIGSPSTKIEHEDDDVLTGAVLIYRRNSCTNKWILIAVVNDQPQGINESLVGSNVALTPDGQTLISFSGETDISGKIFVSVYTKSDENYIFSEFIQSGATQFARTIDFYVAAISDNGCLLAIAYAFTDEQKGQVEIFKKFSSAEKFESFQVLNGATEDDRFGSAVELSGDGKALFVVTNPTNVANTFETLYVYNSTKYFN